MEACAEGGLGAEAGAGKGSYQPGSFGASELLAAGDGTDRTEGKKNYRKSCAGGDMGAHARSGTDR